MKLKNEKEKNSLFIQEININKKALIYKIFRYFYSIFQAKKEYNVFYKCVLYFIETIQLISYAFSYIHFNSWKIELSHIQLISNIIDSFRLSTFMVFVNYKVYSIILYFFFGINFYIMFNSNFTNFIQFIF